MSDSSTQTPERQPPRWRRWIVRIVLLFTVPPALYFGAAEAAMRWPINGDVDPLEGSIDIYVCSNGTHVDIWVPAEQAGERWADVLPADFKITPSGYLAIGWGDRAFYTQVPEWKDLTLPIALKGALLPTASTLHVTSWWGGPKLGERIHLLGVDPEGYQRLCEYIREAIELGPGGRMVPIDFKGHDRANDDRYFEAHGSYHLFQTCNNWTNGALKAAGKKAAAWAPLARGVVHQLPKNGGQRPG